MQSFLEKSLSDLKRFMHNTILNYLKMRGKVESELYWDAVVITACDGEQALAFRLQLEQKQRCNQLPIAKYIVVEDTPPFPGCKIGAGGSTFLVIEQLRRIYGDNLNQQKILLIHAGGWSQRLPSASILGKLFMPLPIGDFDMDMLDLKLALYLPFIPFMKPGIFLTASDDIEVFNLTFPYPTVPHSGFVCLGHPSSLQIGSTHGVFVCDPSSTPGLSTFLPCHRVLQKPSEIEMRDAGAVLHGQSGDADNRPFVISDSAYWFDMEIVEKLETFYREHELPQIEVDAYGDFLQPLGAKANEDYIEKAKDAHLKRTRRDLFDCLRDSSIHVLFLPQSLFIHLGTMPEYLHNMLDDNIFRKCFEINNTCMKSSVSLECDVSPKSVLEFCDFSSAHVKVNANCFLSGCYAKGKDLLEIPENTFMHTVVLSKDGCRGYATIFCGIEDDIKREVNVAQAIDLHFLGRPLPLCKPSESVVFPKGASKVSIWTLKLFRICATPLSSFEESLQHIHQLLSGNTGSIDEHSISMADVLALKDVRGMLELRAALQHSGDSRGIQPATEIVSMAIQAVKPESLIRASVDVNDGVLALRDSNGVTKKTYRLSSGRNIYVLAVGKAGLGMFTAVYTCLEDFFASGFVIVPCEQEDLIKLNRSNYAGSNVTVAFGGRNNLPNHESVESTTQAIQFLKTLPQDSLLLVCISGGASAVLVAPKAPVTLDDKLQVIRALAHHGAPIQELNAVRGCLSDVKFGGLLHHIPAGVEICSIILSDIIGDPVGLIGGAPTVKGETNPQQAVEVLEKYGLWEIVSVNVKNTLASHHLSRSTTVWPTNVLIGNNMVALRACRDRAESFGYQTVVLSDRLQGFAKNIGMKFADIVQAISKFRSDLHTDLPALFSGIEMNVDWKKPVALFAGGESTVQVRGTGKGGRNQEMVLAFALQLLTDKVEDSEIRGMFVSVGTDGQDGPTDAAGAVIKFPFWMKEGHLERARAALENNDSYNYFCDTEGMGQLIRTGPTGTNVMDLQLLFIE